MVQWESSWGSPMQGRQFVFDDLAGNLKEKKELTPCELEIEML
jgi:hypothetical protein